MHHHIAIWLSDRAGMHYSGRTHMVLEDSPIILEENTVMRLVTIEISIDRG